MNKNMEMTILTMPNGFTFRMVVKQNGEIHDIFESDDIRNLLNIQLELMHKEGWTSDKFRVRK